MKTKTIIMGFASKTAPSMKNVEEELRAAIGKAKKLLLFRHDINVVEVDVKDKITVLKLETDNSNGFDDFSYMKLKGISKFLLKEYPDVFSNCRVGSRLLNFMDVGDTDMF